MMKFRALNEESASDESDDPEWATREAQEEEAFSIYNNSLKLHLQDNLDEAEELLQKLLQLEFITKEHKADKVRKGGKTLISPALNLKYLAYKNLASIANKKKDYHSSVDLYLKALDIDSTDVQTWFSAGKVSLDLTNYPLAQLCFEEGLKCSPDNWLCLDNIITITYALNDYANCLYYISKALEKEPSYLKGLILKDKIFKEDPNLRSFCGGYFIHCDPSIHYSDYDAEESEEIVKESLELRRKTLPPKTSSSPPNIQFSQPLKAFTWESLGESLISTYNFMMSSDPPISLTSGIDLSSYNSAGEKALTKNQLSATSSSDDSSLHVNNANPTCSDSSANQQTESNVQPKAPAAAASENIDLSDMANLFDLKVVSQGSSQALQDTESKGLEIISMINSALDSNKRVQRKKRLFHESVFNEFTGKRRSTRVRNPTIKRPQDNINYQELLQCCLPSKLVGDGNYDDLDKDSSTSSNCKISGDHTYGQSAECTRTNQDSFFNKDNVLTHSEKNDVIKFLSDHETNNVFLNLLYHYVLELGMKSHMKWPSSLFDVFCNAFIRLRKHITIPDLFCGEFETDYIKELAYAILTFGELKVDNWYLVNGVSKSSTSQGPKMCFYSLNPGMETRSATDIFQADVEFLIHFSIRKDILEGLWSDFIVRALWLKAKLHSVENEVDMAVSCVSKLLEILQYDVQPNMKILVPNSVYLGVITMESVQQLQDNLQRCQSLEEVQRLYESGDYRSVADLLICTFNPSHATSKVSPDSAVPERHAQLILLQESLWKLKSYQECVRWTEVAFNEAIQQYMNASNNSARSDWTDTMTQLLRGLEKCAQIDKKILNSPEDSKLVRFTQNLILVICLQVDSYEISLESSLTVLPWITLYRLILNEESNMELSNSKTSSTKPLERMSDFIIDILITNQDAASHVPSSILILFIAHECLGRRSYCCASDGKLLLHCVDVLMEELKNCSNKSHTYREELENSLEQCFYCLYGHPNKRTKAKHLHEHNAQQISLTWERALQVYEYFRPNVLPEFDSYRTSTVSADLENLLKRISVLVPGDQDPSNWVDSFSAYVEGGTDKCPKSKFKKLPNIVLQDLYYLLGDYYFKNKEFSKAIRYYLLDICLNPDRHDSWAGMALSRSSQLDQKLNSYEVRNESTIWRKSSSALRCFDHALELNSSITSLWIEYGSLAYVLHSHASKQLKQNSFFDGPRDLLKSKKEEMLVLAEKCFMQANQNDDGTEPEEAWLHHYMLGKIAQKQKKEPTAFLEHYQKSLFYLHEDGARYPQKIQYHNPPELSIEVLEVSYRIHASCLKFLSQYESTGIKLEKLKIVKSCLAVVSESPFTSFQEKVRTASSEVEDTIQRSSSPLPKIKVTEITNPQLSNEGPMSSFNNDCAEISMRESQISKIVQLCVQDLMDSIESVKQNETEPSVGASKKNYPKIDRRNEPISYEIRITTVSNCNLFNNESDETQKADTCGKLGIEHENSSEECLMKNNSSVSVFGKSLQESTSDEIVTLLNSLVDIVTEGVQKSTTEKSKILCLPKKRKYSEVVNEIPVTSKQLNDSSYVHKSNTESESERVDKTEIAVPEGLAKSNVGRSTEKLQNSISETQNIDAVSETELEESKLLIQDLIQICLNALRECLKRFIQHYKSLYRIAHYYCSSTRNKNLQWAREILLAATPASKCYPSMPGLFAERKNTNFFNGIWRAPSNEIDRPGSFGSHMYRSVYLLISVLSQQMDYNMLLYVTQMLYRTPDLGKKYMRDAERISLTRQSYNDCVSILQEQMNLLLQEEPPPEENRLTCCLLEIYRTYQTLQKFGIYADDTDELLIEAYRMYKLGEVDPYPSVLEQAIAFCQLQLGKSYQLNSEAGRYSSKQHALPYDESNFKATSVSVPTNFHPPDAWQREFAKSLLLSSSSCEKPDVPVSSLILIPVDNQLANAIPNVKQSISTQLVQVEKPSAENMRACSMAFLPVTSNKTPTVPNPSLLSCQAYDCYNLLETLMQASGYQVVPQTTSTSQVDLSSLSTAQQLQIAHKSSEMHYIAKQHVAEAAHRKAWKKWMAKTSSKNAHSDSVTEARENVPEK